MNNIIRNLDHYINTNQIKRNITEYHKNDDTKLMLGTDGIFYASIYIEKVLKEIYELCSDDEISAKTIKKDLEDKELFSNIIYKYNSDENYEYFNAFPKGKKRYDFLGSDKKISSSGINFINFILQNKFNNLLDYIFIIKTKSTFNSTDVIKAIKCENVSMENKDFYNNIINYIDTLYEKYKEVKNSNSDEEKDSKKDTKKKDTKKKDTKKDTKKTDTKKTDTKKTDTKKTDTKKTDTKKTDAKKKEESKEISVESDEEKLEINDSDSSSDSSDSSDSDNDIETK